MCHAMCHAMCHGRCNAPAERSSTQADDCTYNACPRHVHCMHTARTPPARRLHPACTPLHAPPCVHPTCTLRAPCVHTACTLQVSEAVLKLLTEQIPSHLPAEAIHDPNAFRQQCCYTEEVDSLLRRCTPCTRRAHAVHTPCACTHAQGARSLHTTPRHAIFEQWHLRYYLTTVTGVCVATAAG